jgi:predicted transcriptional regulator
MNKSRPDVIEILEVEKQYHADQIRRINVAIAALKGETSVEEITPQKQSPQKTTKTIQWTAEIKDLFKSGDVLTIEQARNKLIEKGIVEAMTSGKSSIYSTFSRLKKGGYLVQPEYGKYRKR